jgi:hypothetical protein
MRVLPRGPAQRQLRRPASVAGHAIAGTHHRARAGSKMNDTYLRTLAEQAAAQLSEQTPDLWLVAKEAYRGFGVDVYTTADSGLVVNLQCAVGSPRIYAEGMYPKTRKTTHVHSITVAEKRASRELAKEIERRLLPAYGADLAEVMEYERVEREAYASRVTVVNAVEGFFGPSTDFGEYDPGAGGSDSCKVSARLPLRGRCVPRGQNRGTYPDSEFARVTAAGYGDLMSLELSGIPRPVMERMLGVLADYTAMYPPVAACCERYGTPHQAAFAVPGCPQHGTADEDPKPAPVSLGSEFDRLYNEYLGSEDALWLSWQDWLRAR